jgi:hypothetical protein
MTSVLARLLGWASIACCLIVVASFGLFVVNQTSAASTHQQNELVGTGEASSNTRAAGNALAANEGPQAAQKPGTVHRLIDEAAQKLTSPFSSLTSGSHSQWAIELVGTLLALFLYGFVVRFVVARMMHVRG